MQRRTFLAGAAATALTGCGSAEPVWAPDDVVNAKTFRGTGPKSLTLYTMKNIASGSGEHTSLLVDASQRVMWDPAGSFKHPAIPERNDVLIGVDPRVEEFYVSYHARVTFYVVGRKILVSPEVAERALQLVMTNGAVPKANCATATSAILRKVPGFETMPQTWFPNTLDEAFARLPGVVTTEYREDDSDDKTLAAERLDAQLRADL